MKKNYNTYFEVPSYTNSYWAGFIAADGNVCGNKLYIELSSTDENHLCRFKEDCGLSNKITNRDRPPGKFILNPRKEYYSYSRIQVSDNKLITDLANEYGVVPRKSKDMIGPVKLDDLNLCCYLAGLIDGDGCLYVSRKGKYTGLTLTIVSASSQFLDFLELTLKRILKLDKNIRYEREYMGCLMLHNKEVLSLYDIVQPYNLPLMKRKQDKMNEYILVKNDANYVDLEEIS